MTLKEADEAAVKGLPVIYKNALVLGGQEIEYKRITETGYRYDEKHERHGFVQLLDKHTNSVIYADPAYCTVKN